uniref:Uncharacterized protein n=1 Tax=Aureoumbra lagunensis TaxID=44058 RepID=A0A7S3K3U1_9STRA
MEKKEERTTTLLKCVVLGSSNVGKTSLLTQFIHGRFDSTRRATTGADFASRVLEIDQGRKIRLVIWDTAGQERFHHGTLGNAFYRGADGALLVYDTTDIRSFEQIEMWRGELLQRVQGPPDEFPVVVVGNKIDIPSETRDSEFAAVQKWCRDLGIGICLTSAKDGTGVLAAMEAIAHLAYEAKQRRGKSSHSSLNDRDTLALDNIRRNNRGAVDSSSSCCK